MNINFNPFGEYETPDLILCNPNRKQLLVMGKVKSTTLTLTFNGLSELTFTVPNTVSYYDMVVKNRLVLIDDIGYFIITSENEISDGFMTYKEISCKSLEYSLNKQIVNIADGTYVFWNPISPNNTMLDKIIKSAPYSNWKIGYVSSSLWNKYRTFEVSDSTLYSFIMTDVAEAYQAIFKFDTLTKTINVYSPSEAVYYTNISFTYDNLIKSMSRQTTEDEIITALSVVGDDTLDISLVNPMGTNMIYNFDYVLNTQWMSTELINAIKSWQSKFNSQQLTYANTLTNLKNHNSALITFTSQKKDLVNQLNLLETVRTERIVQGVRDLSDIKYQIDVKQNEINNITNTINAYNNAVINITNSLNAINNSLKFENNFTPQLLEELEPFIYTGTYQNENFGVLSSMTEVQKQDLAQDLYNQGVDCLKRLAQPTYTLDINSVAYLFNENRYEYFRKFSNVGAVVSVELPNEHIFQPVILQMIIPYDNPDQFQLKLSNKLRLNNAEWTFAELQGELSKVTSKVAISGLKWNESSTISDEVSHYMNNSLNLVTQEIINSDNQTTTLNQHGISNKRLNPDGSYSGEEMRITNNVMAFSQDNFRTSSLAVGKIPSPYGNGSYVYGVIGDALVGRVLAGNQLLITNENNYFRVDGTGATLYNANLTVLRNDNRARIVMDANNGFMLQTNEGYGFRNSFYVDYAGNIVANDIVTNSGKIGGWTIRHDGLYSPYGDYLKSDGTFKISLMTGSPHQAVFDGYIYAKNLDNRGITTDKIGYNQVDNGVLGNNAVSTGKIQDRAVTENKLDELFVNRLYANFARIGELEAETARINNLVVQNFNATNATIGTLNARVLNVETLKIDALQAKKIAADEINTRNLVAQNGTFTGTVNLPNGGSITGGGWGININSTGGEISMNGSTNFKYGVSINNSISVGGSASIGNSLGCGSISIGGYSMILKDIKDGNGNIVRVLATRN